MKSLEFAFEINWPLVTILKPLVLLSIKVCWAAKVSTCFQSFFHYWLNQSKLWNSFGINRLVGLKASLFFIRFTLLHLCYTLGTELLYKIESDSKLRKYCVSWKCPYCFLDKDINQTSQYSKKEIHNYLGKLYTVHTLLLVFGSAVDTLKYRELNLSYFCFSHHLWLALIYKKFLWINAPFNSYILSLFKISVSYWSPICDKNICVLRTFLP